MKGLEKFIIVIYSLFTMAIAVMFLGVAAPLPFLDDFRTSFQEVFNNLSFTLLAFVVFVLALWVFLLNLIKSNNVKTITRPGEIGEYRISFEALENLVLQATRNIKGVRDTKTRLSLETEGLVIYLKITSFPDMKIPELVEELQRAVKNYVEDISGVDVVEVKVLVDNISKDLKKK